MPLEMGREGLEQLQLDRPVAMETEVFAYGRMPLAFSARCFTARHRNIPKDNCQYVCMDHPDGLLLQTRESQPFLVLNGIQTQSAHSGGRRACGSGWPAPIAARSEEHTSELQSRMSISYAV